MKHFRLNNPESYIILTGHGLKPTEVEQYCDFIHWENEIIESEIGYGHPKLVNLGIQHAISKGFDYLLKTRADSINLRKNIFKWCLDNLDNKKYLITQPTVLDSKQLGDLFLFGDINFFKKCWDLDNWDYEISGLEPHANNFIKASDANTFREALIKNASLKNIYNLRWICLRGPGNWEKLKKKKNKLLLNKLFKFRKYLWGSSEGWFSWSARGKLKKQKLNNLTEDNFVTLN